MQRKYLTPLFHQNKESELSSRISPKYRLWKGTQSIAWSNPNNWSNTGVPSGSTPVLFAGNSKLFTSCQIDANADVKSIFVRSDYNGGFLTINFGKQVNTVNNFRFDSDYAGISLNTNTINIQSGNLIIDTPKFVALGNSTFNLSGGFLGYNAALIGDISYFRMLGSGGIINSNIPLTNLLVNFHTHVQSDLVVNRNAAISGELVVNGNLLIQGENARLNIAENANVFGDGNIIIERDGYFQSQQGFISNDQLIIRNNTIGTVLSPGTYSCRNIIFQSDDFTDDKFVFQNGDYSFSSNVIFSSTGTAKLTIDNSLYNSRVEFQKHIDVYGPENLVWKKGPGTIVLGKSSNIGQQFNKFRDGRGYANVATNPRGLALSAKNVLSDQNILYIIDRDKGNPLTIDIIIDEAHTVGDLTLSTITANQLGDLAIGRTFQTANEQLYIGDFADSGAVRDNFFIYRAAEPTISGFEHHTNLSPRVITGVYQTGTTIPLGENGTRARDCNAFFVHYQSSDIYLITAKTNPPQLFFNTGGVPDAVFTSVQTFQYLGNLKIGSGVVGADITRDGREIIVKTWDKAYYYPVAGTGAQDIRNALTGLEPTLIRDYIPGYKDFSVCWGSGTKSFYTISSFQDGVDDPLSGVPLYHYDSRAEINFNGVNIEDVTVEASGHIKVLTSSLNTESLYIDSGIFNVNGQNIRTTGDFYSAPGANYIRQGFNNSVINVGGNFLVVGSQDYKLQMHPDSGLGSWQLQVGGSARAYYAEVRGSHASGGNTIYAYNSHDYDYNRNWVFAGLAGATGNMPLYIAGLTYPSSSGQLPLYLFGKSGDTTGLLNLFIQSPQTGNTNGLFNLYLLGAPNTVTNETTLVCVNLAETGSIPLFVKGKDTSPGIINLTILNQGIDSGVGLYVAGHQPTSGNVDLYTFGTLVESSGVELVLNGSDPVDRGVRIYTHGRHSV